MANWQFWVTYKNTKFSWGNSGWASGPLKDQLWFRSLERSGPPPVLQTGEGEGLEMESQAIMPTWGGRHQIPAGGVRRASTSVNASTHREGDTPHSAGTEAPVLRTPAPRPPDLTLWTSSPGCVSPPFIRPFNQLVNLSVSLTSVSGFQKSVGPRSGCWSLWFTAHQAEAQDLRLAPGGGSLWSRALNLRNPTLPPSG